MQVLISFIFYIYASMFYCEQWTVHTVSGSRFRPRRARLASAMSPALWPLRHPAATGAESNWWAGNVDSGWPPAAASDGICRWWETSADGEGCGKSNSRVSSTLQDSGLYSSWGRYSKFCWWWDLCSDSDGGSWKKSSISLISHIGDVSCFIS